MRGCALQVLLANYIESTYGVAVNSQALFDIQVKRIHEYKRQYMNILSVIHRYLRIKAMTPEQRADVVPRVIIFGGKAAPGTPPPAGPMRVKGEWRRLTQGRLLAPRPRLNVLGYYVAKQIIKLINRVAEHIDRDSEVSSLLKVRVPSMRYAPFHMPRTLTRCPPSLRLPCADRVPGQLQRLARRDHHAGQRHLAAHLDRGHRGVWHQVRQFPLPALRSR